MHERRKQASMARFSGKIVFAALLAALAAILAAFPVQAWDRSTRVVSILSSATRTAATGTSSAFEVSAYTEGQIFVDVTAESGSSTLDVTIQTSPDQVTWYTHTTMSQISATGQVRQAVTNFGKYIRISYVVGGTSFTFSITGVFKN